MYTYPANECSTDAIEQRQDRHKRVREAALIKTVAAFEWQIAIDFGCGIGRNLPHLCALVDPSTGARICAIDPDVDRLGKARADFGPLKNSYTDLEFVTGSYLELQGLFPKNSVDFILCCQVLTHMDRALFRNVMETFRELLRPDGVIVICVPFYNSEASEDFFHLVDTNTKRPNDIPDRQEISGCCFDDETKKPSTGRLPVRAFSVNISQKFNSNSYLPVAIEAPSSFLDLLGLKPINCFIYSVHEYRNGRPFIGDIIIKIRKS